MTPNEKDPLRQGTGEAANAHRMRGFVGHLLGYFIGMIVIVPLNLFITPERHWFLFPLVGWGAILSLHAAYVMGFLDFVKRG